MQIIMNYRLWFTYLYYKSVVCISDRVIIKYNKYNLIVACYIKYIKVYSYLFLFSTSFSVSNMLL